MIHESKRLANQDSCLKTFFNTSVEVWYGKYLLVTRFLFRICRRMNLTVCVEATHRLYRPKVVSL